MHTDGSRVEKRIEIFGAERWAWNRFATNGARQFFCRRFATRTDENLRPCSRKGECRRTSRASRSKNENAAPAKLKFASESAEHTDIIGIAPVKRAIPADDDGVDRADLRSERFAIGKVFE